MTLPRSALRFCACLAIAFWALAGMAVAQDGQDDPALLVANEVLVEGEDRLVATGQVEALQGDRRLTAETIIYDRANDRLIIEGPIRITDPENNVILLADQAELDDGFRNGLLKGARMVLDDELQMAAVEARRVEGRYTQLSKVAVTSCQVCGKSGVPLWQIRASRVIHDQEARQIYFENAQFRVGDLPIFYLPRLRLPDPTLDRARGFLFPTFTSSTLLGFGVKTPYFIPIGRSQDLTLTPWLTTKSRTLEFRYRRAFRQGDLQLTGAMSSDALRPDDFRWYLFTEGDFALRGGYRLSFDLRTVSDSAYLNAYDITDADRLNSDVTLSRYRRDSRIVMSLVNSQTLRVDESTDTQPAIIGDVGYERRFLPVRMPGELRFAAETHGHFRPSELDIDSADADNVVDGRDVYRVNAEVSWRNRWTLGPGIRAGLSTHLWLDHTRTRQDAATPATVSQATPGAALELRWPFQRTGSAGGHTLIEPVIQAGWVGGERARTANDESTRVEFDEANLLSLSRFPSADRRERGATLATGLRWLHEAPGGWTTALTVGRVWRDELDGEFSRSSGLEGRTSDLLIAGRFANPLGLTLSARGLLDEDQRISKAEARAGWSTDRMDLGASYLLLVTDPDEDRGAAQSEWTFDGRYQITRHWQTTTEARYDLADDRLDRVGLGLQYRNECIQVDLGATRKFASARNLEPSTDFDLTVALNGFGTGGSAKEYRRECRF